MASFLTQPLFTRKSSSFKESLIGSVLQEIELFGADYLLNTNVEDLVRYFERKHEITLPVLQEPEVSQEEIPLESSTHTNSSVLRPRGTRITLRVPYGGNGVFFLVQASDSWKPLTAALFTEESLLFEYDSATQNPSEVKAALDTWLNAINQNLKMLAKDFAGFTQHLGEVARKAIDTRRSKLLADRNLVASLGFRIKRHDDVAEFTPPPVVRRVTPRLPPATPGQFKPEPELEMAEYEHILKVVGSMSLVMERSPRTFHNLDEEAIRVHFLVQLNGHYHGGATGETFNYDGKTDILVRVDERNIFIAECKVWAGASRLTATIDQLLGYISWRDAKAAILLFNRNKGFSNVLREIPSVVEKHPNLCESISKNETSFRYRFRHRDDSAKNLMLTVIAFNIPSPP